MLSNKDLMTFTMRNEIESTYDSEWLLKMLKAANLRVIAEWQSPDTLNFYKDLVFNIMQRQEQLMLKDNKNG